MRTEFSKSPEEVEEGWEGPPMLGSWAAGGPPAPPGLCVFLGHRRGRAQRDSPIGGGPTGRRARPPSQIPASVPKVKLPFWGCLPLAVQYGGGGKSESKRSLRLVTRRAGQLSDAQSGGKQAGPSLLGEPWEGGRRNTQAPCPLQGPPLVSPGLSAPGHPSSLPQKVGMERPSPAKAPLMVPGLSPSAHETARTSSGGGSSPPDPGSSQPRR